MHIVHILCMHMCILLLVSFSNDYENVVIKPITSLDYTHLTPLD